MCFRKTTAVYEREICLVELSGQIVTSRYFLKYIFLN